MWASALNSRIPASNTRSAVSLLTQIPCGATYGTSGMMNSVLWSRPFSTICPSSHVVLGRDSGSITMNSAPRAKARTTSRQPSSGVTMRATPSWTSSARPRPISGAVSRRLRVSTVSRSRCTGTWSADPTLAGIAWVMRRSVLMKGRK